MRPRLPPAALRRKGKGDDVTEDDMEHVVHAHNTMNEITWQQVQGWEALHRDNCPCGSTLLRFRGRPDDLSPLARIKSLFGGPLPFDRHDWYLDRCGKEVRYVIDFYFDDEKAGDFGWKGGGFGWKGGVGWKGGEVREEAGAGKVEHQAGRAGA